MQRINVDDPYHSPRMLTLPCKMTELHTVAQLAC
jgi:hypothetical protein